MVGRFRRHSTDVSRRRFWEWFTRNEAALRRVEGGTEKILRELNRELERVATGLTYQFGPVEEGLKEFAVSADGIRDRFTEVIELVSAAPTLPGWRILAFRPRAGTDAVIQMNDVKLPADSLWFTVEPDGDRIGLTLFIPALEQSNHDTLAGATFILLDMALGEYDVETKLGWIEHKPLPPSPAALGLRPFNELPESVDRLSARDKL